MPVPVRVRTIASVHDLAVDGDLGASSRPPDDPVLGHGGHDADDHGVRVLGVFSADRHVQVPGNEPRQVMYALFDHIFVITIYSRTHALVVVVYWVKSHAIRIAFPAPGNVENRIRARRLRDARKEMKANARA